jgi:hypothetical protein
MTFTLTRTLPDGTERTHDGLASKTAAASAACYVLTDNLNLRRKDAEPIGFQLEHAPLGTVVPAYGYTFRIERA